MGIKALIDLDAQLEFLGPGCAIRLATKGGPFIVMREEDLTQMLEPLDLEFGKPQRAEAVARLLQTLVKARPV